MSLKQLCSEISLVMYPLSETKLSM